jgi:hypothetical protein
MIRSIALVLVTAVLLPCIMQGQIPFESRKSQTSGVEYYTTNYGIFGHNVATGEAGFSYPRGSEGIRYIAGSGLWFGAMKRVYIASRDTFTALSFITYNPNSGNGWGTPGEWSTVDPSSGAFFNEIAYSPEYDRRSGIYNGGGYRRPRWPLWNDPSIVPSFRAPGEFIGDTTARTPEESGSPAFVPLAAEQFVSRYHDGMIERYEGQDIPGHPLGLEIVQNVYSFASPGPDSIVILHFSIVNVGQDTLVGCYAGWAADPDLGDARNDRTRYYSVRKELQTAYVWSEAESPKTPGMLSITLLESPAIDTNFSSPGFGFIRHDMPEFELAAQVGVTGYQNWSLDDDPTSPGERYNFMESNERDGDAGAGDRRVLLSAGPFSMMPGDTARFAIALVVLPHLTSIPSGPRPEIERAAEQVHALYQNRTVGNVGEHSAGVPSFSIGSLHPNPAGSGASLELHLERRSDVRLRLVDALGRVVFERRNGVMEPGDHPVALDLADLARGVYVVTVDVEGTHQSQRLVISY